MVTATASKDKSAAAETKPIKQEIKNLAAAIKADLTIDPKTGAGTLPKNMYERLLPEEVSVDMVEKVASANADIAAALGLAVGEASLPLMKKHKELERVTANLGATGRDRFEAVFDRTYEVPVSEVGADGKRVMTGRETRFGQLRVGFNSFGTRNAGQMALIKTSMQQQAMAMLTKG